MHCACTAQCSFVQVGNIHALRPGGTLEAAAAAATAEQALPSDVQDNETEEVGLTPPHSGAANDDDDPAGAVSLVAGARQGAPKARAKASTKASATAASADTFTPAPLPEGWLSLHETTRVWAMVGADAPPPPLAPHPDAQPVPPATHATHTHPDTSPYCTTSPRPHTLRCRPPRASCLPWCCNSRRRWSRRSSSGSSSRDSGSSSSSTLGGRRRTVV